MSQGAQPQCSVTAWRGGMGVGGGGGSGGRGHVLWLIHVQVWQRPTQHCKAIISQLKIEKNHTCVFVHADMYVMTN